MPANAFITNTPTRTLKKRRAPLEQFLRTIGIDPAQSTSRNPLEQPWSLTGEEFAWRVKAVQTSEFLKNSDVSWKAAREETAVMTEEIGKVEVEVDERVKALYGV